MSGPTNSYHLRAALMERFNELARITGHSKTDMVNEAVERYVNDEMMRIAMSRHRFPDRGERSGAIKHGSKMIQAVANARVPKFTVVLGGSYGAGNYGMCGRGFDPRFIFAWPTARTAVMGGAQAAKVMDIVNRAKLGRAGVAANEAALQALSDGLRQRLDDESAALFGTARLWDDGIIDPRDTRRLLGLCLALAEEARTRQLYPNTFGVARM